MKVDPARWQEIQKVERAYHEQKDPARILSVNLIYWRRILAAIPPGLVPFGPQARILDVGCGGAGILLAVDEGERTGVDPLMGYYLERFPFLKDSPVQWVEGTTEALAGEARFDVIFSINMLDHVIDPRGSARNLEHLLAPGGRLVLVLNVHLTRFWRAYYERFYRWVDPPHPHHIHSDDVEGYFPGLKLSCRRDIDDLWFDLKEVYDEQVCHKREGERGSSWQKALVLPLYPIAAARLLFGRPFHRRTAADRPIMASTLFVFARP